MLIHRVETKVSDNGSLIIERLPFQPGDEVEVIVRSNQQKKQKSNLYPLRGTPFHYKNPLDSVAEGEWEVLK